MSALYMFFIRNFFPCLIPFTPKPIYLALYVYPIGNTFTNTGWIFCLEPPHPISELSRRRIL